MENVHCIYHANCTDGFTAAWAVWKKHNNVVLHPANYGEHPPELPVGAVVFIVDFSYPMDYLIDMAETATSIVVLDHHVSAVRRLEEQAGDQLPKNVTLVLDTERSGARLAWDYMFGDELSVPNMVKYVEDRDLWRFQFGDNTRRFVRALMARPFTVEAYDAVFEQADTKTINEGAVLVASDERHIEWHMENALRMVQFGGHLIPLVNAPKYLVSEITNILVQDHPMALAYHDTARGRLFRITTSKKCGIDAAALAEQYGGGGHVNAAGFFVPRDHHMALI